MDKNLPCNAGALVRSLVGEDSTCHTATKPVFSSELLSPQATATEAYALRAHAPKQGTPVQGEALTSQSEWPHSQLLEKACTQQHRLSATTNKQLLKKSKADLRPDILTTSVNI